MCVWVRNVWLSYNRRRNSAATTKKNFTKTIINISKDRAQKYEQTQKKYSQTSLSARPVWRAWRERVRETIWHFTVAFIVMNFHRLIFKFVQPWFLSPFRRLSIIRTASMARRRKTQFYQICVPTHCSSIWILEKLIFSQRKLHSKSQLHHRFNFDADNKWRNLDHSVTAQQKKQIV